eukprot:3341118-Alexandrium_andersonii.AAC.1
MGTHAQDSTRVCKATFSTPTQQHWCPQRFVRPRTCCNADHIAFQYGSRRKKNPLLSGFGRSHGHLDRSPARQLATARRHLQVVALRVRLPPALLVAAFGTAHCERLPCAIGGASACTFGVAMRLPPPSLLAVGSPEAIEPEDVPVSGGGGGGG